MKYGIILLFGYVGKGVKELIGADDTFCGFDLIDIIKQVKDAGDVDAYAVCIKSPGGFVQLGGNIYDYLQSLTKPVYTIAYDECSSIATKPLLAAPQGNRYAIAGTKIMIHNPWTSANGNAQQLSAIADDLLQEEEDLLSFYAENTNNTEEALQPLMAQETFLSTDEAMILGFIDKVITAEEATTMFGLNLQTASTQNFKALALSNPKKTIMKKPDHKTAMDKVRALAAKLGIKDKIEVKAAKAVALDLKTADGKTLTIAKDDNDPTPDVPQVGDVVTLDGQPAPSQTLTMDDGTVIETDANSAISSIETSSEEDAEGEMEARALKAEKELAAVKKELADSKKEVVALKKELDEDKKATKDLSDKLDLLATAVESKHTPDDDKKGFRKVADETKGETHAAVAVGNYKAKKEAERKAIAERVAKG